MKLLLLGPFLLLSLVACAPQQQPENPKPAQLDAAVPVVERWANSVRTMDLAGVRACLAKDVRDTAEYAGSAEALAFWKKQLEGDLTEQGFTGEWRVEAAKPGARAEAYVRPVLTDGPGNEAIWLVREDETWKVSQLFVTPPKD